MDAYIAEAEDMEREAAIFHNSRIPKSLIVDRKDFCSVDDNDDDDEEDEAEAARNEMERENARTFVERLGRHMEALLGARGAVEVDVRLQEFASKFCEGIASFKRSGLLNAETVTRTHFTLAEFSTQSSKLSGKTVTRLILNADGIYLSSYAALHLNLKLSLDGHYKV